MKRFCRPVGFCVILSLLPSLARADELSPEMETPLPASMGAMGDSLTAGALARFRRQEGGMPLTQLLMFLRAISFGQSRDLKEFENRELSWSTGLEKKQRVPSHAARLVALKGGAPAFPIFNAAVSGAESRGMLSDQMGRLTQWSQQTLGRAYPDYVTMMIGANDACAASASEMVSVEQFRHNVTQVVDDVLIRSPETRLLIGSMPDASLIRDVAKDAKVGKGLKCETIWKASKMCATYTLEDRPQARAEVAQRIRDYGRVLAELAATRSEIHGDRVRFADQTFNEKILLDELSVDCFHPNIEGQARIANVLWQASWWAR